MPVRKAVHLLLLQPSLHLVIALLWTSCSRACACSLDRSTMALMPSAVSPCDGAF